MKVILVCSLYAGENDDEDDNDILLQNLVVATQ